MAYLAGEDGLVSCEWGMMGLESIRDGVQTSDQKRSNDIDE